jgi:chromosome segregation ATPase
MSIQRQKPACLWIHDCQWVKYGDHLAELAAKEREIERLKAQVERLRAPLSKSEAAELNNAGNAMNKLSEPYHKCVNRIIASRAAEKGGEA